MLIEGRFPLRFPQNLMIPVGFAIFSVDFDSFRHMTGCHVANFFGISIFNQSHQTLEMIMKKISSTKTLLLASSLCLGSQLMHAQTILWNDNFSGVSLNSNLSVNTSGLGAVTQASNQLTMNTGEITSGARAGVYTTTDQTGTLSTFNGADLYNFYDHTVTTSFDIAGITATTSGRPQFYFSIGEDAQDRYTATQMDLGVSFGIELSGTTWRFFYTEQGTGAGSGTVANFSGLPTGITYTLDGTLATIDITGATFTAFGNQGTGIDADTVTVTMSNTLGNFNDYTLAFGAQNRTALNAGAETEVILNSFEVSVIPEPSTYVLLGGCVALAWVMVRRRRS